VFFLSSLGLTYLSANHGAPKDLMQGVTPKAAPAPAPSKAAEIPQPAPNPAAAAPAAAPSPPGSKSGDVPK
jgi:hypothetical protein